MSEQFHLRSQSPGGGRGKQTSRTAGTEAERRTFLSPTCSLSSSLKSGRGFRAFPPSHPAGRPEVTLALRFCCFESGLTQLVSRGDPWGWRPQPGWTCSGSCGGRGNWSWWCWSRCPCCPCRSSTPPAWVTQDPPNIVTERNWRG